MSALIWTMYVVIVLFGVIPPGASAQSVSNLPRRGSIAPPFDAKSIDKTKNTFPVSLNRLRGKVVVLEFWATWCAPCVDEIPKINALLKATSPEKVQFVSITDEDPAVVRRFLQRHPMMGSVVTDSSGRVFDRYRVVARPATVVIDTRGRVASNDVPPDRLSISQLLALSIGKLNPLREDASVTTQAGGPISPSKPQANKPQDDASDRVLVSIKITQGRLGRPHLSVYGDNSFNLNSASTVELVQYALGYSVKRITVNDNGLEKKRFDLSVQADGASDISLKRALAATIESAIGAKIEHQVHDEDVLVLDKLSTPSIVKSGGGIAGFDPKKHLLVMINASLSQIASAGEDALGRPVISEVLGNASCTGTIDLSSPNEGTFRTALEEKCGIGSKIDTRAVDRIEIVSDQP